MLKKWWSRNWHYFANLALLLLIFGTGFWGIASKHQEALTPKIECPSVKPVHPKLACFKAG